MDSTSQKTDQYHPFNHADIDRYGNPSVFKFRSQATRDTFIDARNQKLGPRFVKREEYAMNNAVRNFKYRFDEETAKDKRKDQAQRNAEEGMAVNNRFLLGVEKTLQEARWAAAARSRDNGNREEKQRELSAAEKTKTCWHSTLCSKTTHALKFKCHLCGHKRRLVSSDCPHCGARMCEDCANAYTKEKFGTPSALITLIMATKTEEANASREKILKEAITGGERLFRNDSKLVCLICGWHGHISFDCPLDVGAPDNPKPLEGPDPMCLLYNLDFRRDLISSVLREPLQLDD